MPMVKTAPKQTATTTTHLQPQTQRKRKMRTTRKPLRCADVYTSTKRRDRARYARPQHPAPQTPAATEQSAAQAPHHRLCVPPVAAQCTLPTPYVLFGCRAFDLRPIQKNERQANAWRLF